MRITNFQNIINIIINEDCSVPESDRIIKILLFEERSINKNEIKILHKIKHNLQMFYSYLYIKYTRFNVFINEDIKTNIINIIIQKSILKRYKDIILTVQNIRNHTTPKNKGYEVEISDSFPVKELRLGKKNIVRKLIKLQKDHSFNDFYFPTVKLSLAKTSEYFVLSLCYGEIKCQTIESKFSVKYNDLLMFLELTVQSKEAMLDCDLLDIFIY